MTAASALEVVFYLVREQPIGSHHGGERRDIPDSPSITQDLRLRMAADMLIDKRDNLLNIRLIRGTRHDSCADRPSSSPFSAPDAAEAPVRRLAAFVLRVETRQTLWVPDPRVDVGDAARSRSSAVNAPWQYLQTVLSGTYHGCGEEPAPARLFQQAKRTIPREGRNIPGGL